MNNVVGEDMSDAIAKLAALSDELVRRRLRDADLCIVAGAIIATSGKPNLIHIWNSLTPAQRTEAVKLAEKTRDRNTSYSEDTTS